MKCPHIKTIKYVDFCKESERPSGRIKPCLLMSNKTCEEWEQIKKEWEDDNRQ